MRILAWLGILGLSVVSLLVTAWLVVHAVAAVRSSDTAPWTLGRASGLTAYALLVLLVSTGLVLAHPAARRLARPRPLTRLRVHVSLAVFTLTFTLLHVVVLATDPWAGVGWRGALLPMASAYRPVGVTLGVIAVWAGLVTGVTAALAGRVFAGAWWPMHKVAAAVLALVWVHGVVAGSDSRAMTGLYLASGGLVAVLTLSRYIATTAADRCAERLDVTRMSLKPEEGRR